MNELRQLFAQFRDVTVVFGNMGRHPALLEYYATLYLSPDETWAVVRRPSNQDVAFLFVVEPYFGCTILKPDNVKQMVVWTSHLNLTLLPGTQIEVFYCSQFQHDSKPVRQDNFKRWTPPLFYREPLAWRDPVQIDVSRCKTIHETFLRLLTGYEMIPGRLFSLHMEDFQKQMLKMELVRTREKSPRCWFDKLCETLFLHVLTD